MGPTIGDENFPVPPKKGWHRDPYSAAEYWYWDGAAWGGHHVQRPTGVAVGHYTFRGWRKTWYLRIGRWPVVFYPLVWMNCSVPGIRGHLSWLTDLPQRRAWRKSHGGE